MSGRSHDEKLEKLYSGLQLLVNAVKDKNVIDDTRITNILTEIGLEKEETISEIVENFIRISAEIYIDASPDKQRSVKKLMAIGIPREHAEPIVDTLIVPPPAIGQIGTYFKDLYANLKKQVSQLPDNDPSPNLQACVGLGQNYVNFVRAEMLAKQHHLPSNTIIACQELAIMEYLVDYQNIPGLRRLIRDFRITPMELNRIIDLLKREKVYPCYSFSKATEREGSVESAWPGHYEQTAVEIKQYVEDEIKGWSREWYGR